VVEANMTIIANPVRESDVTRLRLADVKRVKPGKLLLFMFFSPSFFMGSVDSAGLNEQTAAEMGGGMPRERPNNSGCGESRATLGGK